MGIYAPFDFPPPECKQEQHSDASGQGTEADERSSFIAWRPEEYLDGVLAGRDWNSHQGIIGTVDITGFPIEGGLPARIEVLAEYEHLIGGSGYSTYYATWRCRSKQKVTRGGGDVKGSGLFGYRVQ